MFFLLSVHVIYYLPQVITCSIRAISIDVINKINVILLITSMEITFMLQEIMLIELFKILKFRSKDNLGHSLPNKSK